MFTPATPEISAIREVFSQIPSIDKRRAALNLAPLVNCCIGQPHLAMSPVAIAAMQNFLASPDAATAFGYSPAQGRPETLAAIVALYNHYYPKVKFSADEVIVTVGASQALYHAFNIALAKTGGQVLVFEPYFSTYKPQINALGGELIVIPTAEEKFRPKAAKLKATLQKYPNTKAILLNYPNNPSSVAITRAELETLATVLRDYPELMVIIDDVYRDFATAEHVTLIDVAPDLLKQCVIINSGSKGLVGAPDMRVGMMSAHKNIIQKITANQLNMVSGVSWLSQFVLIKVIAATLNADPTQVAWLNTSREVYQASVKFLDNALQTLGLTTIPAQGGFFLLVNASSLMHRPVPETVIVKDQHGQDQKLEHLPKLIGTTHFKTDRDIANYLLHAAGVASVRGSGFGIAETAGYLRFSCANSIATLQQVVNNLKPALAAIPPLAPHAEKNRSLDFSPALLGQLLKFADRDTPTTTTATVPSPPTSKL